MLRFNVICILAWLFLTEQAHAQTPYSCPFCDLSGRNFSGQDLTNANFSFAKLDGANFSNCTINGAMFDNASLQSTNFSHAQLNTSNRGPANFILANCSHAIFSGASLHGAIFCYANVNGAQFDKADLTDAKPGLKLVIRDSARATAPNFEGAILPCNYRRFLRLIDLSKARLATCAAPAAPARTNATAKARANAGAKASAADSVYVSPSGTDDAQCGTAGHPCQTLKVALKKMPDNGVMAVAYGAYNQELMSLEKPHMTFVGGLDDQNNWQATKYQSAITSTWGGFAIFSIYEAFMEKGSNSASFSHFAFNSNPTQPSFTCVLQVEGGGTMTLSDVNVNAGQATNGGNGTNGYDSDIGLLGPTSSPLANCGAGGKANSDLKGSVSNFWERSSGGSGESGFNDPKFAAYPGGGAAMGGMSMGIFVGKSCQLILEDGVTIVAAKGGDGGNGGAGYASAGGGAGGNAGPSVCVVLSGPAAKITGTAIYYDGQAGQPGKGGPSTYYNQDKSCYGQPGQDGLGGGIVADTLRY